VTDPKMPAVGETWYSETYSNTWGELTVVGVIGDMVNCRSGGGVTVQPGKTGMFFRSALSRRIRPAPEATEGPKVGEMWSGVAASGKRRSGAFTRFASADTAALSRDELGGEWFVDRSTLRRLDAQPSVTDGAREGGCPRCGSTDIDLMAERCNGCGVTVAEIRDERMDTKPVATPTPKADPYLQYGIEQNLPGDHRIAQMMAERDARLAKRRRFTADTLDSFGRNDLDRPLLKLGGRFGRRVENGHPSTWPEADEGEP
jgi:hypothetical protein